MQEVLGSHSVKKLLVYCYFCPEGTYRPGGVQQIVAPLLSALSTLHGWNISVVHPGPCDALPTHFTFTDQTDISSPDFVNPRVCVEVASYVRSLTESQDVVLSIDRLLPCTILRPCLLMSNTLAYMTEVNAVQANQWQAIIVPTNCYAQSVRTINKKARVYAVPYGLPADFLHEALEAPPPQWESESLIVRLPHRPDRRKGHHQAIEGLARALPESKRIALKVSWLNEERYDPFKDELMQLAEHLGVGSQVSFHDWQNGSERSQAIVSSCATLQLGSYTESFGLSVVESLLFGRPAVVQDQAAIREIVMPNRLFLEIQDPLHWYSTLRSFWPCDFGGVADMRQRHALVQTLSLEKMATRYHTILSQTIQSTP